MKHLFKISLVLLLFSSIPTIVFSAAPTGTLKDISEDDSQNIKSFFRSIEYFNDIQTVLRNTDNSNPQEKFDAMIKLAKKIIEEDKMINKTKLDIFYPSWGTTYKENFVKGVSLLLRGLEQKSKTDFAMADGFLADWDTWWRNNHSQVFLTLHEKFGFEIK